MLWAKKFHCIIHLYLYNIQKLKCKNDNCLAIFVHFSPLGSCGTYQFISVYLVYFNLIRSNLVHLHMGLKPQAQKGPHELMDNQFSSQPSLPRLYSNLKLKKKTRTHYKLYIQFITNLFLPLSLSVFIFNTANYSWSPV